MGHGKETPRQKMIGMMYLVLTALLALNVSKDVLDAFVKVDEGLTKTTKNFVEKNQVLYKDFDRAVAENPEKAKKWRDKAYEVKTKADELVNLIQDLKLQIIEASEGEDTEAIDGKDVHGMKIQGKDNTDVPAQIMVGDNNDAAAKGLRAAIEDFREFLFEEVISPDAESVRSSIASSLNTDNPPPVEGHTASWESEHFEHLPLIAVVTIMSSLQSDIRNAETEALRYLYTRIDAGAFKFNQLEAVVIPNTNYVLKGNPYSAKVFIAAYDTTQAPKIYVGSYDSTYNEETGMYTYHMTGNYDSLDIQSGKGIYNISPTAVGPRNWGGLIVLKSPDGGADIKKPFHASYTVSEPSLTISATKMNVFYLGVDNPVDIAVPGVTSDQIDVNVTNAAIRKVSGSSYVINPRRPGNSMVTVLANIDGNRQNMGFKEFRVDLVPDPEAQIAGEKGGSVRKNVLLAQNGILAAMPEWFKFDLTFKVTSFTVSTTQSGFVREA
ncbi:MAG: gliding motility protein GldM, partial [Bacteroidota bacterium]